MAFVDYLFWASVGVAAVAELLLQLRTQSDGPRDPSYVWMLAGSTGGVTLAFVAGGMPGPSGVATLAGVLVMWAGFALRVWAVRTLGRYFTVEVTVGQDQQVVDTGPYARMRHPSYTGLLVFYLGLGIGLDSWLSVAAAALLPLAAIVNRIGYEEKMLRRELGDPYDAYSARTARLVPGLW